MYALLAMTIRLYLPTAFHFLVVGLSFEITNIFMLVLMVIGAKFLLKTNLK